MARNIESIATVQGRSRWRQWASVLASRRGGLQLYQWLWLLLCVVLALVVAAPRVLSQPVIYQTSAIVSFDVERYSGLYDAEGQPGGYFVTALQDSNYALTQRAMQQRELRFGAPEKRVDFVHLEPGMVQVVGTGPTAAQAVELADQGAAELTRQIRAAGGREVLRNLLGWELVAALHGEAIQTGFQWRLRQIIEHDAFPMSRRVEPVAARIAVGDLPIEEQRDLTRALEARYDLWDFEINTRNATLDAWCGTANLQITAVREQALQACAAAHQVQGDPRVQNEIAYRNDAIRKRQAIAEALRYMLDVHRTTFDPVTPSAVSYMPAVLPAQSVPRHIGLLLGAAVLAGLAFGSLGVTVDRAAGVMPKLQELWSYRALTWNMVLRDLRTRYKGSTLGYLWTQLAPLLMMLVFLFVFTVLIASPITMFPVFLIVALLPWNYCAEAVGGGTRSILDNAHLIKKVFFPREVLPLSSVFSALVNFLLSLPMMFLVMIVTQMLTIGRLNFGWSFAYLPVLLLIQTMFLLGVVFLLSGVAVFFRDTVHLIGIVLQFWFFLTPVFYSLDIVGDEMARVIRWVNPMASLVDFYRDILYGSAQAGAAIPTPGLPALDSVLRVLLTSLLVLAFGYWVFQRNSGRFGEEL